MKKLPKEENCDSSDERYKARITEQQQEHYEELKKLQESFEKKEKKESNDINTSKKKEEAQKKEEKEVNVSKKKNILKIITEAFTLIVQPKKWESIVSELRSLFHLELREAELLKELKYNNKTIASLLHNLKNKDRLSFQLRIAGLLREIIIQNKVSKVHAIKLSAIQGELISNLKYLSKVDSQQVETKREQIIQKQIDQSRIIPANVREMVSKLMGETKDTNYNLKIERTNFKPQSLSELQYGYYQINNPHYPVNTINMARPFEYVFDTLKVIVQRFIITPVKEMAHELLNMSNNYNQKEPSMSCRYKNENHTNRFYCRVGNLDFDRTNNMYTPSEPRCRTRMTEVRVHSIHHGEGLDIINQ